MQAPLLRQARKNGKQLPLPIYGNGSKYVELGVQTNETDLALDDEENEFGGDYVIPKDDEIDYRIAVPYLSPYRKGDRSIDTVYGLRREDGGTFTIGDSQLLVEVNGDVTVLGVTYEGTEGQWELLTKTNVYLSLVTTKDMRSYKHILKSTNGHLSDNVSSGHLKTFRGPKYRDVISKLFPT
jgi:hypothetical protein